MSRLRGNRAGFSLVEIIVVMGILAVVLGLLIPAIGALRQSAGVVRCQAQLHQLGQAVAAYANDNSGSVVPMAFGPGLQWMPWRLLLFDELNSPDAVAPFLICPTGVDFNERQTYMLNGWVLVRDIRLHGDGLRGRPPSTVIIAGENLPGLSYDYYPLVNGEALAYDPFRHGVVRRSNYLWLDLHVSNEVPEQAFSSEGDPWYIIPNGR